MTSGSVGPSRDLRDAEHPDASTLRRVAVMLTGSAEAAEQLVLATLNRVDRGSRAAGMGGAHVTGARSDPVLVTALVRKYLRRSPRRQVDRVEPAGGALDAGEVLGLLRPHQRAAAVLVLVQGWSAEDAAGVLGVPVERMSSLVPQTTGLADALRASAYHHDRPVSDLGRRSGALRRSAAAVGVVMMLGVAVVNILLGDDDASRAPVDDTAVTGTAARSADLGGRGWVLGPGGDPPAFLEGLRLIDVSTIDYADPARSLTLDTVPRKGQAMYAALWCDMPPQNAGLVLPTVALTVSGHTVALPCAGRHDDPPLDRLLPLPPPDRPGRVPVLLRWEGDLPGRGSAVLATYTEFGQNEPPRTTLAVPDPPPTVPAGAVVLGSDHGHVLIQDGAVFERRVRVSSATRLSVWSGGTGRFTILVDGVIVSDDGDVAGTQGQGDDPTPELAWRDQDPQLRDGSWTVHAPGQSRQFPLPAARRPAPGEDREVTVRVHVATGSQGRWQVQVSHSAAVVPALPDDGSFTHAMPLSPRTAGVSGPG